MKMFDQILYVILLFTCPVDTVTPYETLLLDE